MKKLYFLVLFFCLCIGYQGFSQCPFNNSLYTTVTPPCPGTTTVFCTYGGEYITVNVVAGNTYTFSTCGNTSFDTQLTLYNNTGTTVLAYNDDACGFQSTITWVATYTGTVNLLLDQFSCASNATCMDVAITCTLPAGGGTGCNTNTTICTSGIAGPFGFGPPGNDPGNCLDWYASSQFAYIILYITTSGPLEMLIQGNNTGGASNYFDVSIYNIPSGASPCSSLVAGNLIGCNYAASTGGCNQFGTSFGCASNVPSPWVNAGDVLMIIVEDWLNGPSTTFTLDLGNPPAAQTGPPDGTVNPAGPFCITAAPTQITAANMGGTWTGPGISSSGMFDPAAAGVGTHTINYSIGSAPCLGTGSTTITVFNTPPVAPTNTGPYCVGQTISLTTTAVAGATYSWSGPGGYSNTGQSITRPTSTTAMAGVYTVTVTAGGCSATGTTTVVVNANPIANATNTGPYCAGATIQLNSVGGSATDDWAGPGGYTMANTQNPTRPVSTVAMSGVYTVTLTNAAGCTSTSTTTVVVNANPIANATNTGPYCAGATIQLNSVGGSATDDWAGPGGYTMANTQNPTRPVSTVAMSGVYTVTLTNAAGCTSTSTTTVVVNANPIANATNTGPYCAGATIQLNSVGGSATDDWAGPGGYTAANTQNPTRPVSTVAMSGVYTVTLTNAAGCTSTSTTTVVVNANPIASATNTGPYCEGATIQLNSVGGSATDDWAGPGGYTMANTQNPTRPVSTVAMSGVYTVTLTNAAGCTSTSTITVVVNANPIASATNTGPYCAGVTIQLNSVGGSATDDWAGPGGYTMANTQNPTRPVSTVAMSGVYTVTLTNAAGCTSTSTTTVVVNALPVPTASNTGPYCAGANILLSSSGGGTYSWNGPLAYSNGTQNPTILTSTAGMAGVYTVTVTNAAGCTATATTTVVVNANPVASATNGGPYCAGATIQLNSVGGSATDDWAGPGGYTMANTQNPTRPGATVAMGGVYTVTVTNAAGCTSTSTTTVTVNALPVPTATNTGPYCAGASISLSSTAATSYSWSGPLAYSNATQNPTIAGSTAGMGGVYTVTVTNLSGCTATATTTVVINALPVPTAGNTGPYCAGASIVLSSTGGGTYGWAGPLAYSNATQNPTIGVSTTGMSGIYTVTVTNASGCTATATTTVVVNALPVPTATNTGPYCPGNTIQLNSSGGTSYSWSGPLAYSNATQNPTIGVATTGMGGVYTVTVTNAAGCTATATTTVSVAGTLSVTATSNSPVCVNQALNLSSTLVAGGTYSWSGPGAYSNATQNPTINPATVANTGTYTVSITDASGCSGTATVAVVVNALPIPTASNTGPYCVGASIVLSSTGGGTYNWAGPLAYSNATQNPTIASSTTGMGGVYTVTVTNAAGCTATATTTVTVNVVPIPTAGNTGPYCAGANIWLTSSGGTGYSWSGPLAYSNATQNPSIASSTTGMGGIYTVTVTNAAGCTATATTTVIVNATPVPTAGNTGPYCEGVSIALSSSGGTGYSWSGPLAYANATQNPTIASSTTGMGGVYTVTVSNAAGCTATATTTVVINALPIPTATNTGPYCVGSAIQLNSSGGTGYSWSGPLAYSNGTQNPSIASSTTAMSGVYTVTVTNAAGCTATNTTNVTVNSMPTPTATNTGPYCVGTTIQLNSTGGGTYSWSGPLAYSNATQNPTIGGSATGMTGIYTVTVTLAGGCFATATTTVTVNALPTPTAGNTGPYCPGATIQLSSTGGTGYSWSGPLAYANATQNPSIAGATTGMSGVYTVTATNAAGCTATATTTVLVNASPVPTASNMCTHCPGDPISFSSSGGSSYLWVGPLSYTDPSQNPVIASATPAMSGVYTVTVTNAAGCTATDTTGVIISILPIPTATNTGPYCVGSTIQLNSSGGASYVWSGPSAYANGTQNPTIANATIAMNGVYTVTAANTTGCTATATTTVVVNSAPVPTATNTGPYCVGSTIQLNSSGGTSYSWVGPSAYSNATQNPTIPVATTAMSGLYTVTVTNAAGCTSTLTTNVVVNTNPIATATNTGPYCAGSTIQLNSSGGATYSWSGPGAYANGTQNPTIGGSTVAMTGIYTVTVTLAGGCFATATTNVIVNALPTPTANNTGPYCSGGTMDLNSSGGVDYDWAGPGGFLLANTQNGSISGTTPGMSGTYTVTVTDANGCVATANTLVTINGLPVANASNNTPICELQNINLNSSGGTSYSWSGPLAYSNGTQNPTIMAATVSTSGTYTVTVTDANGCVSTATTNVVVNANPVFTASSNSPICAGTSLNLTAQTIAGVTYNWSGPNGFSAINQQNPSIGSSTTSATGIYTVIATSAIGCTGSATVNVLVNPVPTSLFAGNNLSGCAPMCVNFTDLSLGNGGVITNWSWIVEGQIASTNQNVNYCFNNPGAYDAALTVTTADGCTASLTIPNYINVSAPPLADFIYSPEQIKISEPEVIFASTSTGAVNWLWDFGDGGISNIENPTHTYQDTGIFCATLLVANAAGCTDTVLKCLYVQPVFSLYIPNAFTVNDDGLNETFNVYGVSVKTISVRIFDRWGEEIYFFDDINKGWPGNHQNGQPCKQDAYVYRIEVVDGGNNFHEYVGQVTLIR